MGGCRCYFRDCHVNSRNFPSMHFFRFPVKEAERFRKWREYSQMEQMLEWPETRRKNSSVCGRHFRQEHFMNYKQERLSANAVPTIMRLSVDKALDFELDIENGILVDIEKPKLNHLLLPNDFDCPLALVNDKILIQKLKELQSQQNIANEQMEVVCDEPEELEDANVAQATFKRPRQKSGRKKLGSGSLRNIKCRILNTSSCTSGNEAKKCSTVVLASLDDGEIESNDINFVETVQIEKSTDLENNGGQMLLTTESSIYDSDENIEYFEDEIPLDDSEATTLRIESGNVEVINVQNQLHEFDQLKQQYSALYGEYSSLEIKNKELKQNCKHIEEMKKNLLELQVENVNLKISLKNLNFTRKELYKYSEENKTLKDEIANTANLRSELFSTKEQVKDLKKLLQRLKCDDSKNCSKELDLKEDLNEMIEKFESSQQELKDTTSDFKEAQVNLNNLKNEIKRFTQNESELKKSLDILQSDFNTKQTDWNALKFDFDNLQKKHSALEEKYLKLLELQSQEATVSTSLKENDEDLIQSAPTQPVISVSSLTKAQLFNGIKRYLCRFMVTLLRMEMFGGSEREWKKDERQIAVDILRLGEIVYHHFTDEWRIRLPSLRDARGWLSQSQQLLDDDEDL